MTTPNAINVKTIDNTLIYLDFENLPSDSLFLQFSGMSGQYINLWASEARLLMNVEKHIAVHKHIAPIEIEKISLFPYVTPGWMEKYFGPITSDDGGEGSAECEEIEVEIIEEPEPIELSWKNLSKDVKKLVTDTCFTFRDAAKRAREDRFAAAEAMLATLRQKTIEMDLGKYGFRYIELWDGLCQKNMNSVGEALRCLTEEARDELLEALGDASPHAFRALEHATRVAIGLSQ